MKNIKYTLLVLFILCGGVVFAQTKAPRNEKSGGAKHAEKVLKANPEAKVSERKPASVKGKILGESAQPAPSSSEVKSNAGVVKEATPVKDTKVSSEKAATLSNGSQSKVSLYEMEGVEPGPIKKSTTTKKAPIIQKSAAAPKSGVTLKTKDDLQINQQVVPSNEPTRKSKADLSKGAAPKQAVNSKEKAPVQKKELPKKQ